MVKNPPAMQESRVQSLGREDPLEEDMTTHFSILAWRIPWTEEAGGLRSMGSERLSDYTFTLFCLFRNGLTSVSGEEHSRHRE